MYKNIIDRQFIAYCRIILLNKSRILKKQKNIYLSKEIPMDDLTYHDLNKLHYFTNFEQKENEIEYQLLIHKLYKAIMSLPSKDRDIIIMKYWGNLTDQEIADNLKLLRRTVNYNRHKSLAILRKYLEEDNQND